jgi:hypothetical protein
MNFAITNCGCRSKPSGFDAAPCFAFRGAAEQTFQEQERTTKNNQAIIPQSRLKWPVAELEEYESWLLVKKLSASIWVRRTRSLP